MAKAFGLIMMLIALYIGMTIYTEGIEQGVRRHLRAHRVIRRR